MLLGMLPYAHAAQELIYHNEIYDRIDLIIKWSWATIPKEDTPIQSFLHIIDGSKETYAQFLARLQEAVHRQIPHSQIAETIVFNWPLEMSIKIIISLSS